MPAKKYDCLKCPGYCCSYPVIEVKDRDAERIAKHFDLTLKQAEKKYFKSAHGYKRVMRRQKDEHFGKISSSSTPRNGAAASTKPALPPAASSPAKAAAVTGIS